MHSINASVEKNLNCSKILKIAKDQLPLVDQLCIIFLNSTKAKNRLEHLCS